MPKLADARIEAPNDHELWQSWFTTPSLRATGRTNHGKPVVLYAHTDNYFSSPENIRQARKEGLINYAGKLPQEEFERLLSLERKTDEAGNQLIYVIDHDKLKRSASGVIPVSKALQHPQTIPFLGGKERAERYLERHQQVFGDRISVWHCDDLGEVPVARLLYLGYDDDGLDGDNNLSNFGRFFGVRRASEASKSGVAAQKPASSLEAFLKFSLPFMPTERRDEYETKFRKEFK